MTRPEIILAHPVRTAIGKFGGALKDTSAVELGGLVIAETLRRARLAPEKVGGAILGSVIQAGQGMNPARQAARAGGLPVSVPAMTVNRVCGSGAQAIVTAAQEILSGQHRVAVAGGFEAMDRAPYLLDRGRFGYRMGPAEIQDAMLRDGLSDAFSGEHSGWHTEDLVARQGLSRERQDAWALRSQKRFAAARDAFLFAPEIVGTPIKARYGTTLFAVDESPRPETTAEGLAALKPAFRAGGTLTAGNAPGLSAGAAAMIVADRAWAEAEGLAPAARLISWGVAAVEPGLFGLGPIPAVRIALERAGWRLSDLERVEINEAFAAVPLAVCDELGLPEDVVNVEGGAIAHGHPIGATGAILLTRLIHGMARAGQRRGLVTLCIGGGMGIAVAVERP
ncbi:thiolase family protein [uncultured Albimonas sp.]|uniref:thiolase family protein n=1 Tax=uncultured Albimonas sp. TaxID=1331701 RepID=UPI0030EDC284